MLFSGKWFDPVIGIDIHLIQPPGPVPPIPVPHPFIGIVYDPIGQVVGMAINASISGLFGGSFKGPVLINGMPAANTGMRVKSMPVHMPIGGVFVNPPSNEGTIITGSKTVHVLGASGARLTSSVITCNDPVNLPTSVVMSIPMGAPVFTGGPTAVDWMAAILSAIRTKWVSDKLHEILGAESGSWLSKAICFFTGHPVEVVSGRVMTDFVDFELPGLIPLKFERSYYSASEYNGPLGHGWHHTYDQHISVRSGRIFLRLADGREISVEEVAIGHEVYEPVERLFIKRQAASFVVSTADKQTLTFGPESGLAHFPLTRIEDRNRNAVRLEYANGSLSAINDYAGRRVRLENDISGRIVGIFAPHPDMANAELRVARFVYDSFGDLISVSDALGHAYHYEYSGHRLIRETNRSGLSFYFEYESEERDARCVHTWGDGGIYNHKITYYPAAHITIVEDSLGEKTTYHWNDVGLVTRIVDPLGNERTFAWDRFCRKVSEKDAEGRTKEWHYGPTGELTGQTIPASGKAMIDYNDQGLPVTMIDAAGQRWSREYDSRGNVTSAGLEGAPHSKYEYDERGSITSAIDPLGAVRRFSYNLAGFMTSATDARGNVTRYGRNQLGSITSVLDPLGNRRQLTYNVLGKLVFARLADGGEIRYEYDPEGNVTARVAPDGSTYRCEYGFFGRVRTVQRPSGGALQCEYDSEGRLLSVLNDLEEVWSYSYNAAGRLVEERDFSGRVVRYEYDRAGLLKKRINGNGQSTEIERNENGQLVRKRSSDGTFAEFAYNANGSLLSAVNQSTMVSFERDAYGHVLRETQDDRIVQSFYDERGLRTKRRTPSGQEISFGYDGKRQLERLTFPGGERIEFWHDENGRNVERVLKNSGGERAFVLRQSYDPVGRLTKQKSTAEPGFLSTFRFVRDREFTYDWNGAPVLIAETPSIVNKYRYDSDGRVLEAERQQGRSESFQYDSVGNIRQVSTKDAARKVAKSEHRYTGRGGRLGRVGETTTYLYDADGQLLEKSEEDKIWKYEWTAEGQLRSVRAPSGDRWEYEYDPFGRRIHKLGPHGNTTYVWDRTVIAEEIRHNGPETKFSNWVFEPGSFRPLAKLDEEGRAYACVTDQVGTPRELIDSSGELMWEARFSTWGEVEATPLSRTDCPIRFQGQWWDAESGLNYSFHRCYDPETGQYLSPDPLGLLGGTRSYGYVHNPMSWVDPWGLTPCGPAASGDLDWSRVNAQGEDALDHVMLHDADNLAKPVHGVFSGTSLDQVEEAWNIAKQQGIQPYAGNNGNWNYDIPFPDAGLRGGQAGAAAGNPILDSIKIVTLPNSNQVVTAFPF
jgi:RHS repeat-associated protein